jgi:raffinose/stachyose/melibiose transport system permease protein
MLKIKWWQPLLYLTPMVLVLSFVFGYPIVRMFDFSFRRIRGATGPFIGFDNYRFVFRNPVFQEAVGHNLFLLIGVPVLVVLALIFATMLFDQPRGWKVYRFSLFLPYILAIPVVGIVFSYLLTKNGAVNQILSGLHLNFLALDWLGDPDVALKSLLGIIIWKEAGFGIVLFFARLMSVSEELYDAAKIDGTSWWQTLWYITIPQLMLIIEFFAIISIINFLSWIFAYVFVVTKGGPGTSTQVLELWIFNKVAHGAPNPGMGAAASVVLFASTLILIFVLLKVRVRMGEDDFA